ncbi:MAG: class I SAM-dependent methyltransferase [Methyloceanibacter sp.]
MTVSTSCSSTATGNIPALISRRRACRSRRRKPVKKRHLAAKLNLRDGLKVLDIGSGWGGLGLYLAKSAHVDVTGVTLSEEQLRTSQDRARAEGLAKAVSFELLDYREVQGQFDRIVSVGMFEHVGVVHYRSSSRRSANCSRPTASLLFTRSAASTDLLRPILLSTSISSLAATSRR